MWAEPVTIWRGMSVGNHCTLSIFSIWTKWPRPSGLVKLFLIENLPSKMVSFWIHVLELQEIDFSASSSIFLRLTTDYCISNLPEVPDKQRSGKPKALMGTEVNKQRSISLELLTVFNLKIIPLWGAKVFFTHLPRQSQCPNAWCSTVANCLLYENWNSLAH